MNDNILALLQLKNVGRKTICKAIKEGSINDLIRKHQAEMVEARSKVDAIKASCDEKVIEIITTYDIGFPACLKTSRNHRSFYSVKAIFH